MTRNMKTQGRGKGRTFDGRMQPPSNDDPFGAKTGKDVGRAEAVGKVDLWQ